MKTNEMRKGQEIKLRNGWIAEIADNMRGNIRIAKVYGTYTEMGSIYSHDIVAYLGEDNEWKTDIEYTPGQLKCKEMNEAMGF